jgi:ATP citrate (pro-S)-lyase
VEQTQELDDTAAFRNGKKWGPELEFPLPFGRLPTPQEAHVAALDEGTGASLKLSVLNPHGRVWTMVAGGGASVIYADTVSDLGFSEELGNYAEYSGGPNTEETVNSIIYVFTCYDGRMYHQHHHYFLFLCPVGFRWALLSSCCFLHLI